MSWARGEMVEMVGVLLLTSVPRWKWWLIVWIRSWPGEGEGGASVFTGIWVSVISQFTDDQLIDLSPGNSGICIAVTQWLVSAGLDVQSRRCENLDCSALPAEHVRSHVTGQRWAVDLPLSAQAYFCDIRSPLRSALTCSECWWFLK